MAGTATEVLSGSRRWSCEKTDCSQWLAALPDDSVDLLLCSPPYEKARLYLEEGVDLGIARSTEQWVHWMIEVVQAASPKVKVLIAIVCEGQTRQYRYSCAPMLLMADLCRAGFNLRKSVVYHRVGIPGSGGPDWLRNDAETIICVTRPGRLPWSDNTACGHPPRWAPGGEMSHRLADGAKVNQWGGNEGDCGPRKANGSRQTKKRPSHVIMTMDRPGTHSQKSTVYESPILANPGNVVRETYTTDEVTRLLSQASDVSHHNVGGGQMGSTHAHENEASFPQTLAEFFVRSFCQPDGIVADCFAGSGTTLAAAVQWGRRAIGCDLRASQVELTGKRMANVQPLMFTDNESHQE